MKTLVICSILSLLYTPTFVKASCREMYISEDNPQSGNFTTGTLGGSSVRVFCDFYEDRGYTYIHKDDLDLLTEADLTALYTEHDHMIARLLYKDNSQRDVRLEQLSEFKYRYPLGFRLSNAVDYIPPINYALKPYLYVGFLPRDVASIKQSRQGYRAGGQDATFTNCDGQACSYLAIFQNPRHLEEDSYWTTCGGGGGCDHENVNHWIEVAQLIPPRRKMAHDFYYQYEMHMGGCGGYISTKNKEMTIAGASIGFGFTQPKQSSPAQTIEPSPVSPTQVLQTTPYTAQTKDFSALVPTTFGISVGTCTLFTLSVLLMALICNRLRKCHHGKEGQTNEQHAYITLDDTTFPAPPGPVTRETVSSQPIRFSQISFCDTGSPCSHTRPKDYLTPF